MPIDATPLVLDTFPAVVAGPIVRRVTRGRASVWFATRLAGTVTIEVWRSGQRPQSQTATTTPQQCGSNVFVGVVSIDGFDGPQSDEFSAGATYEYELTSSTWPGGSLPVWSDLTYGVATHPSFVGVPDQLAQLDIAHASCRMPHGAFREGMAALDAEALAAVGARPRLLVMSGDQIYADAVAAPLMPRLHRIATDLIDVDESAVFPPLPLLDGRQIATAGDGTDEGFGLSSSEAENHLWGYGEFVAMYLLAWSDTLWPTSVPRWVDVDPALDLDPASEADEASWNELADRIEQFRQSLPAVRRLMANTPTFMVFDDHEVTDDWNLNHEWCTRVYANPAGSRVVLNGLIAYGLFQHWGNVPDRFVTNGSAEASFLAACWTNAGEPDWATLQPLVGVPDAVANTVGDLRVLDSSSIRFDVTIDASDGWPTTIVLLDERTTRRLDPSLDSAGRISTTAIDQMLPSPGAASVQPIVVVAPAPVFGLNLLENQVQPLLSLLPGGAEEFDYEPWAAHTESFEHLVSRIAEFGRAVVLSGDLHFGFTIDVDHREPAAASPSRIAQLVSSGSKRSDPKTVALHLFGDTMRKLGIVRTRAYRGYVQLNNAQRAPFVSPPPGNPSLQYDDIADILLGRVFREAQKSPAVFSDDVAAAYNLPAGDWEYDLTHIDDNSVPTVADHPVARAAIDAAGQVAPWTGWDPDRSYKIVRGLQASDLWRIGHVFSGLSQASKITFDTAGPVTVNHRIVISVGESEALGSTAMTNTAVTLGG